MTKQYVLDFENGLPEKPKFEENIRRAPRRGFKLSKAQASLALKNALRYIDPKYHDQLMPEFWQELKDYGRIYGYRFRPEGRIYGKPIDEYKGKFLEAKAFQVMIDNNLDFEVALYPYELVTYGETGSVFQNWMQYLLIKKYLENLEEDQTLVIQSGHPIGVFKSRRNSPKVIITNALMIGMFDNIEDWELAEELGVANYGQMTAGGWMYIGPQGIVHGTYNTILNAGRLKLGIGDDGNLSGKLFVSSGLGGMSGAQGKAGNIAGAVSVIAEVDKSRVLQRHEQGWIDKYSDNLDEIKELVLKSLENKEAIAIGYHGNVVDLLEYFYVNEIHIDLLSDQTSCHNVYNGGYCPHTIDFEKRTRLLDEDKEEFKKLVNSTLVKHFTIIKRLVDRGTYFFDYGNSFMKAIFDAGVLEISKNGIDEKDGFIWPSYVEDIMGPLLFDYGYGPFRWVCLSGKQEDLDLTDKASMDQIDPNRRYQDRDNYQWIKDAKKNNLVVGTKARILYQDAIGRVKIALKFNEMVRNKEVGPIMIGRDHHDVSGTDSPFRETSNIKDGSNMMADMAVQSFAGNAARGMSLIALHNGGGVGIGKSINGGFGLVLDGSERVDEIIKLSLTWDVMGGVARRAWATNKNSIEVAKEFNSKGRDHITIPFLSDDNLLNEFIEKEYDEDLHE
ncbi:MAG: urocanate hydratase [Tissierellia bacterium]|nr:urocanate hydratase [Tissierellia bacterium]